MPKLNVPPLRKAYATRRQQRIRLRLQQNIDLLFVQLAAALDANSPEEADRVALALIEEIEKLPQ